MSKGEAVGMLLLCLPAGCVELTPSCCNLATPLSCHLDEDR